MATNPNNAVGTNAAFDGRTSPNAFNDVLALFTSRGVLTGWQCLPNNNMVVTLGGQSGMRDVAVAEDNAGNKTTINNISEQPIEVEIMAASTTTVSQDYIVAYVNNPPEGTATAADNPGTCGLIDVRGSGNNAPTEHQIRSAITADGGVGTTAYYVVLAMISVPAGATTLTATNITQGVVPTVGAPVQLRDKQVKSQNVDFGTLTAIAAATTVGNITVNNSTKIQSLTIPTSGKWKISAQFSGYSASEGVYNVEGVIKKNGNNTLVINENFDSVSVRINMNLQMFDVIDANSGDTIDFYVRAIDHSISVVNKDACRFIAERVG